MKGFIDGRKYIRLSGRGRADFRAGSWRLENVI